MDKGRRTALRTLIGAGLFGAGYFSRDRQGGPSNFNKATGTSSIAANSPTSPGDNHVFYTTPTGREFPVVHEKLPSWISEDIKQTYVLSAEDIVEASENPAEKKILREALENIKAFHRGEITKTELDSFLKSNDIEFTFSRATRDYIRNVIPDIGEATLDQNDIRGDVVTTEMIIGVGHYPGLGHHLLFGSPAVWTFSTDVHGTKDNAAIIATLPYGMSKEVVASALSGIQATKLAGKVPGTDKEAHSMIFAHEALHTHFPVGDFHGEVLADRSTFEIYYSEIDTGYFSRPPSQGNDLVCFYQDMRSLGAILIEEDDHPTSATTPRDGVQNLTFEGSPKEYLNGKTRLVNLVASTIGSENAYFASTIPVIKNILNGEPAIPNFPVVKINENDRKILNDYLLSLTTNLDKKSELSLEQLTQATKDEVSLALDLSARATGADLMRKDPRKLYQTMAKLYSEGAMDHDSYMKLYAYRFLMAAKTRLPEYFGANSQQTFKNPIDGPQASMRHTDLKDFVPAPAA